MASVTEYNHTALKSFLYSGRFPIRQAPNDLDIIELISYEVPTVVTSAHSLESKYRFNQCAMSLEIHQNSYKYPIEFVDSYYTELMPQQDNRSVVSRWFRIEDPWALSEIDSRIHYLERKIKLLWTIRDLLTVGYR